MSTYKSYHTCIKQLARTNSLPRKYTTGIDRSTICRWKQESPDKYLGHELSSIQNLQAFLDRKESELLIKSYLKITLALSKIFIQNRQLQKSISLHKNLFVKTLNRYRHIVKISLILRILDLSTKVFYRWKNQVLYPCLSSPKGLCHRIYPNHLTSKETLRLNSLLIDPAFKHWPTSSIAHYARRNNILHVSLSTWYNYIQALGIKRPKIQKKQKNKKGIRANQAHQIWHADITIVK